MKKDSSLFSKVNAFSNIIDFVNWIEKDSEEGSKSWPLLKQPFLENTVRDLIISGDNTYLPVDTGIISLNTKDGGYLNSIDYKILGLIERDYNSIELFVDSYTSIDDPVHDPAGYNCISFNNEIQWQINSLLTEIKKFESNFKTNKDRNYTLAFYKPFHTSKEKWGIYFKIEALKYYTQKLKSSIDANKYLYGEVTLKQCYILVKYHTFYHELYHHKIECYASKIELFLRHRIYSSSFNCFYNNTSGKEIFFEEAFANSYGYWKTRTLDFKKIGISKKNASRIIRDLILKNDPPGYNVAYYLTAGTEDNSKYFEHQFYELLWQYACDYHNLSNNREMPERFWSLFTYMLDPIVNTVNKVTYVLDMDGRDFKVFSNFMRQ